MTSYNSKQKKAYPLDLYKDIFEPDDNDDSYESLAKQFWATRGAKAFLRKFANKTPLHVLAVGIGNGRLELPLLTELAHLVAQPVEAHCVEPNWVAGKSDFRIYATGLSQCYVEKSNSEMQNKSKNITLNLHDMTIEDWLENKRQQISSEPKFDVILFPFVAHLLSDWKTVTAELLEMLTPGGMFVYAENYESIICLDGGDIEQSSEEFRYYTESIWGKFWSELYDVRDSLMIPRQMLLPPRNAGFMTHLFESWGGCASKDRLFCVEVDFNKEISEDNTKRLIDGVEHGASAKTFGALRINDKVSTAGLTDTLPVYFVKKLNAVLSKYTWPMKYKVGVRLFGVRLTLTKGRLNTTKMMSDAQKPINRRESFLRAVGQELAHEGVGKFLATKACVKQSLQDSRFTEITPEWKRNRAIAAGLSTYRDLAAISADSLLVLYSHDTDGIPYSYALLPRTICPGEDDDPDLLDAQRNFISRYSRYMMAEEKQRLSKHFLNKRVLEILQDFQIVFRITQIDSPRVNFGNFVGKYAHTIVVEVPETVADDLRKQFSQMPVPDDDTIGNLWNEWECSAASNSYKLSATYLSLNRKRMRMHNEGKQIKHNESFKEKCADALSTVFYNAFELNYGSLRLKDNWEFFTSLSNGVQCLLNLFMFQWDRSPSWSTVIYSVTSVAQDQKGSRATTLLAFLSEEDSICHNFSSSKPADGQIIPIQTMGRSYSEHFLEMASALSLYLSEIELVHYSIVKGGKANYQGLQRVWGHEVSKIYSPCKEILENSKFDSISRDIINVGLQTGCLWTAAESLYEESFGLWLKSSEGRVGRKCADYLRDVLMVAWRISFINNLKGGLARICNEDNDRWNKIGNLLKRIPIKYEIDSSFYFASIIGTGVESSLQIISMTFSQLVVALITNALKHAIWKTLNDTIPAESKIDILNSCSFPACLSLKIYKSDLGHTLEVMNTCNPSIISDKSWKWHEGTPLTINVSGENIYNIFNLNDFKVDDFAKHQKCEDGKFVIKLDIPLPVIETTDVRKT